MTDITVSIQLDRRQAQAYLTFLISQYEQAMSACWYSDRYRYVAEGQRGIRVMQDHPHIAGLARSCRELRKSLAAEVKA